MIHDRTYRPVPYVPAPRLRDADGSMRQAPRRSAGYAATHPVQPLKGLPGTRATDVSYRALAPGGAGFSYRICTGTSESRPTAHYSLLTANSSYTFSAKEKDSETGLSYFGSRHYSSDLSVWLSVDPMSDKYPSLSPYTYCADNPVKLVDPNGEEYELFIIGDDEETANEAFKQLQSSTNLILKRDGKGRVTIVGGEVRNENDMRLQKVINDENVTVTVNAINGTSDDYVMGGSFMGNEVMDKVIPLFTPKPHKVIANLLTRHVFTKQTVDPYETAILDDIGYLHYIPGVSETKAFKGQTMLHEVTESYCGGIDAFFSGVSAGNATVSPDAYNSAHNAATYPPDIMMEQSDVFKIFRERRGK